MKGAVIAVFAVFAVIAVTASKDEQPPQNPFGLCPEVDGEDPVYLMDEVYRDVFYECSNGRPILMRCPTGLVFDPRENVCNYPSVDGKPYGPVGICYAYTHNFLRYMRDGTNMGVYYVCSRDMIPRIYKCDKGRYFDTVKEFCVPMA